MGGGNAIEQVRETIDGLDDQQLAAASSAYRDLIAQGVTSEEARARVRADAENAAFVRTLPVSAVGGAATGRILSPAGRVLGDRGVVAQTLGKAALAGTEEAVQEVGEGYATQKGINAGAGMALDPMAGSFGNAALGFVAGMGPGAVHGATEGVRHRGVPSAPSLQAGDVMHASGKPFVTASAARQRAEELGEGAQVLRYENGFIVRPGAAVDQQAVGAAPTAAADSGGTDGAPDAAHTANADGQAAGFAPRQQVYLRQNGRELPVEFLGVESNAATARAGGEQLARIRTADGRGRFVRLSELFAEPMPGNSLREAMGGPAALEGPEAFPVLDGPIQRAALPAPDGYAAGEGFVARDSWRMPANAPRGIRNNNPGNIQKGAGFQGEVEGNDPRFATFATPEDGIRAIGMNLLTYQRQHGLDTVQGILNRWAPPSENDTGAYVGQVARALGVEPNQQLDLSDPATLTGLTAAIIRHENAMQPYNAAQLEAAVSAALSGAPVRRALPAPVYQVDGEGKAATAGQRDAELARQAVMGMTPDVVAAGVRHPGAATDAAAHEAATSPTNDRPEPTDAQKDAGNYKVGRTRIAGMDISIENPEGSERHGTSPDGTSWANRMAGHYGYIRRTQGADGDQVDVFVRPGTTSDFAGPVFVIDQVDPAGGRFDESKVMLGYDTREDAERAYRDSYTPDWRGMGKITQMDVPTFKRWINEGDTTKPASESGLGTLVAEPDITAKGGRPFLTRGAAQRAATLHGNADVEPADGGFVARPRTGQPRERRRHLLRPTSRAARGATSCRWCARPAASAPSWQPISTAIAPTWPTAGRPACSARVAWTPTAWWKPCSRPATCRWRATPSTSRARLWIACARRWRARRSIRSSRWTRRRAARMLNARPNGSAMPRIKTSWPRIFWRDRRHAGRYDHAGAGGAIRCRGLPERARNYRCPYPRSHHRASLNPSRRRRRSIRASR